MRPLLSGAVSEQTKRGELSRVGTFRNNLKGRLPPQLGNLTALQALYVVENNLSGRIPSRTGKAGPIVCAVPWGQ